MAHSGIQLPYFDEILALVNSGHEAELVQAFGTRHVHWGYYPDPSTDDTSVAGLVDAAEQLTDRLVKLAAIMDGQAVLDVGCGFGGTLTHLNTRFAQMQLTGINIDHRQLCRAQQLWNANSQNSIAWVTADACNMPLPAQHFDAILAVECIFHFPSRLRFFREAARSLKPGACLVLSDFVPDGASALKLASGALRRLGQISGFYGSFNWWPPCTMTGYRWLARHCGMRLTAMEDVTQNTLPTYPVLLRILKEIQHRDAILATEYIDEVSRAGYVRYLNLRFDKDLAGTH